MFLEGRKKDLSKGQAGKGEARIIRGSEEVVDGGDKDGSVRASAVDGDSIARGVENNGMQRGVPGGKGNGGRWLFVSHEPLNSEVLREQGISKAFGFESSKNEGKGALNGNMVHLRFVRFQFEPLVCRYMFESISKNQSTDAL